MRGALAIWLLLAVSSSSGNVAASQDPASGSLDYEYFKTRVQPIFVAKRPGHARCIACHGSRTTLRLQPLSPGSTGWNDEDTRKNFEAVRRVVVPGDVMKSRLLIHPLAEAAGGDFYHSGGKHWGSQNDAEWQILKAWVLGQTTKPLNSLGWSIHLLERPRFCAGFQRISEPFDSALK